MATAKKKAAAPKKIKVEALAKELKQDPKALLSALKDLGIDAKTKASSIDEASAKIVKELFDKKPAPEAAKIKAPVEVKPKAEPKKTQPAPVQPVLPKEAPVEKPVQKAPDIPVPKPAEPKAEEKVPEKPKLNTLLLSETEITVKDLASKMNVRTSDLIKELMMKGILATINQRVALDIANDIAAKFGFEIQMEVKPTAQETEAAQSAGKKIDPSKLKPRPPVVTVMGHVDHGKTKLLDAIRKTNVIDTEAGGITQHIGAYQVEIKGKHITFLDTPGHEAFTALRARGANATDIIVLVVAADDGVMPQTKEAIDHAKASNVPIIVAVNKIDKPDANPDRVKQQLSDLGLTPEEWGGETVTVGVSAKAGTNIEALLEMILLVAEMLELKANPFCPAQGVVIESYMDKNMGPVATVLIKQGTLSIGDAFYSGSTSGKVRAMINDRGKRFQKATPATPAKILGMAEVPQAGDVFQAVNSEKEAREIAEKYSLSMDTKAKGNVISLEDFSQKIKSGEVKILNLIIKADVHGSQEALVQSLEDLTKGNIKTNIIRNSTGNVTQSDIMLAKASEAIIVGFNVDFEADTKEIAESEGVDARMYKIIYEVIDDIHKAMEGMLEPEYEDVITGHIEVRQLFRFSKVGTIAGSFVTDGKVIRGNKARLIRKGEQIIETTIDTLKRFKDDVKEVASNTECGITLTDYDKIEIGDIVELYETRVKRRNVKS